jgi:hypothetical protein
MAYYFENKAIRELAIEEFQQCSYYGLTLDIIENAAERENSS